MAIDADALLRSGDLGGARAALVEAARTQPADVPTRLFLFQLLAVEGEWDKAEKQLAALARLSPEAAMLSTVYSKAIAAERERAAVFAGTSTASIHGGAAWAQDIAEAIRIDASGDTAAAQALRDAGFDQAPDTPGTIGEGTNARRFDWIADADPRFGPVMEAIVGGRYGLLPFAEVEAIDSEGPRDLRDLVWYPAEVTLRAGARVAVLLPTRYPALGNDPAERLARATGWADDGVGTGAHLWSFSDGDDVALPAVRRVRFD
jgi:type VI secretion system protein ImpE